MVVYRIRKPDDAKKLISYLTKEGYTIAAKGTENLDDMETPFDISLSTAAFYLIKDDREILILTAGTTDEIKNTFGCLPRQSIVPL